MAEDGLADKVPDEASVALEVCAHHEHALDDKGHAQQRSAWQDERAPPSKIAAHSGPEALDFARLIFGAVVVGE